MRKLVEFHLYSITFLQRVKSKIQNQENYYIYVKEPTLSYASHGFSFYDALQLCDKESHECDDSNVRSIVTNNHRAVEIQFRSEEDKRIIAIKVELDTSLIELSSYVWQEHRRAFIRFDDPKDLDEPLVISLLKRISIKHKGKSSFLSLPRVRSRSN
ncbi:hypothetical protein LC085_11105 [Bacillus tianshenii]|uniref:hypothetical protein n=1 Tax=Sutcliffiella tianshenii TaxID=1463404 RepID=UPI001CD62BF9|nr:hypothetical protein [Bacillus tianshenii]MCA1320458.1 hypothetical protein [Bacillus tianshenii]